MRGLGRMVVHLATFIAAVSCHTCIGFSTAQAQERINEQVDTSKARFSAQTALLGYFGAGAMAPTTYSATVTPFNAQAPNSFNTPRYGAPKPMPVSAPSDVFDQPYTVSSGTSASAVMSNLDWSTNDAVREYKAQSKAARVVEPQEIERDIAAEIAFAAPRSRTGLDFDIGLAPRLEVREEGDYRARSVGAEVRLGQTSTANGQGGTKSWYLFAGADNEALIWQTGDRGLSSLVSGSMKLSDQITVGDMQAGVSVLRGGGQLSLSYIRREVEYRDRNGGHSENEHFAGVSFTLRR